ncbi:unnamed protein product [Schistosoma margrebowiei]|uniref:Uncharacterized protein n=1 Tax=Schistosoma margrebowiei TaxID=48269 RepID=A0A183LDI5_9TREM|nr:unnamed protein product [Schistosoma margrebowiei]
MKIPTSQGKHRIQWTIWVGLNDLDFIDGLALLSYTQQQLQVKTVSVAVTVTTIGASTYEKKQDPEMLHQPNYTSWAGSERGGKLYASGQHHS